MFALNRFKKLIFMSFLALVSQAFGAWDGTSTSQPNQDENGVYLITNEAELAWFRDQSLQAENFETIQANKVYHFSANAILMNDLDMGGVSWTPICAGPGGYKNNTKYCQYAGTFDGNNHRVSNFVINAEEFINGGKSNYAQNLGFIGSLVGTVKNLIIENITVYGYGSGFLSPTTNTEDKPLSIGTVVGWQSGNNSKVDGCYVTGRIITSGDGQAVGGVVGNLGGGTIKNCVSYTSIDANGKAYVGGIVGYTKSYESGKDSVSSCVYAGNSLSSTGSGAVGGIVGYQYKGNVTVSNVVYDSDLLFNGEPVYGFGATNGGKVNGKSYSDLSKLDTLTTSESELNAETIVCALNGKNADGTCKTEPWEMGATALSLNGYGADGYKITFDANGGSFSNGSTTFVKYVKADYIINNEGVENPSFDGDFAFAGWSSETTPEAYMNPASKIVTIKAFWNPVYTITFSPVNGNLNGTFPDGSSTSQTVKVEQGKQISVQGFDRPTSFTQDGVKYNFVGWANAENPDPDNIDVYDPNDPRNAYVSNGLDNLPVATDNMTLVAVWTTAEVWTVTFFADNASAASYVGSVYNNDKATPWVVEYTGYTFDAWYEKNNDGTFKDKPFNFETEITQDYELHAKWEKDSYNITYVMNCSDECVNPNDAQYTVDGLNLSNPTWDDAHRFLGWYTDATFKNKVESISTGTTGDTTLYAEWETIVYEITYRAGDFGSGFVDPEYKTLGIDYTIRDTSYTRKGAKQSGWVSSGDVNYEFGATYSVDAPLVLYPTWKLDVYTILYTCNHCDISDESVYPRSYTVESNFGLPFPDVEDGYVFIGWFKKANYTSQLNNVQAGSTGNLNLYGKVLEQYTITYVGTDNPYGDKTYTVESGAQLRTCAPRDGYTFAGWYDNAEFTGDAVTSIPKGSTGNKTFYAKWNKVYPFVTQSGAVTITEYADGTAEAVINGTYGGAETPNLEESDAVEITSDIEVNSVTLNRTFTENVISTLYVPFEIAADKVEGASVYKFNTVVKSNVDGRWKFKVLTTETVEANTPYIILPSATQVTFDATSFILNTSNPVTHSKGKWEFKGTYELVTFEETSDDAFYVFAGQESIGTKLGQFVKSSGYANPMRAYLVYHKNANVAAKSASGTLGSNILLPDELDIEIENEKGIVVQTGTLNTVTGEVRMDRWFDLKGRKVNSRPSVKGTYYNNGKKVIIK